MESFFDSLRTFFSSSAFDGADRGAMLYILWMSRFLLAAAAIALISRCARSMLRNRYEPEVWGYVDLTDGTRVPLRNWECTIGRSRSSDVIVSDSAAAKTHIVVIRDEYGNWTAYDLGAADAASVNGSAIPYEGTDLRDGDTIKVARAELKFYNLTEQERSAIARHRTVPGKLISPAGMFAYVTLIQVILLFQNLCYAAPENRGSIGLAFCALMITMWLYFIIMRAAGRHGFEVEALAFFLSTIGMAVAASSTPDNMLKQTLLIIAGVAVFIFLGWWLRDLKRVKKLRLPIAVAALALLAVNVLLGTSFFGAKNWISIAGFTVQPSEFVKIAFIYAGAETMDRLYRNKRLIVFIAFSAICVGALALMGDFGTALIFFATFLVISFMRSGNIGTVILAVAGAGLAGVLALSIKPHIAARFAAWGHVWEDVNDSGFQQTRGMAAAASGGFFGEGSGNGWLHNIVAADTDLAFEMVCEELGLIAALCCVVCIILLALFVIRNSSKARSSFYVIAGTAAVSMMMIQMALNVFGSLDILPFTGVTFPFVSLGGSSLISCWALLAYIKATDTRKNSSFVVPSAEKMRDRNEFTRWDEDDGQELDMESPFVQDSREDFSRLGRNVFDVRGVRRGRKK